MPDHLRMLIGLSPQGLPCLDEGTLARKDLEVLAEGLDGCWTWRDRLLEEVMPDSTELALERWETAFGLFRTAGKSTTERQAALIARLRRLPDFNPTHTLIPIFETLTGVSGITIVELEHFRTDDPNSLTDHSGDLVDGQFAWDVRLSSAVASAGGVNMDELQQEIDAVKPAHTHGTARCIGFFADDPYSLTDRDLLST